MFTHPGKKLNFMGNELAEFREWSEEKELGWNLLSFPAHDSFFRFFQKLCQLYREKSPLYAWDYHPDGFRWIDVNNAGQNLLAYCRKDPAGTVYAVVNFSPRPHYGYRLKVEEKGEYRELLNTDALEFGGTGLKNDSLFSHTQPFGEEICLAVGGYSALLLEKKPFSETHKSSHEQAGSAVPDHSLPDLSPEEQCCGGISGQPLS